MIYTCSKKEYIEAIVNISLELSPSDYLYCINEQDLIDSVEEDLIAASNYGDVEKIFDSEYIEFNIPKEFIEEWIKLKKEYEANEE